MAPSDLVAIVKQNALFVFIKSERRAANGKAIQSEIYNLIKADEILGIGKERFTKEEYEFLYNDQTGELLVSHPIDGKTKLKSLGFVEYREGVDEETRKKNLEIKSIIEYLIS